jgi:hypothetical protein
MNRRQLFTGIAANAAAVAGVAVAVKASVQPSTLHTVENSAPDFRMEKVAEFDSPVSAMVQFRDQLVVCTERGDVFALSHDVFWDRPRRMSETG